MPLMTTKLERRSKQKTIHGCNVATCHKSTINAINLSTSMMTKYLWTMAESNKFLSRFVDMAHMTSQLTQDAIKLLAMMEDSKTRLKGKPQGTKHVAWSERCHWPRSRRSQGAGQFDQRRVMASVAGAIGAYIRAKATRFQSIRKCGDGAGQSA